MRNLLHAPREAVDHVSRSEVEDNVRNENELNHHFKPKDARARHGVVGEANPVFAWGEKE